MKKKILELNVLEMLLCFMVIFIHISSRAIEGLKINSFQLSVVYTLWKISSVAVPGFIFTSAFKFIYSFDASKPFSYGKYIIRRIKIILIPYLIWALIYYFYYVYIGWYAFDWTQLVKALCLGDGVAHLYFIVIIFQFYLLAPLWLAIVKKYPIAKILITGLLIMLFSRVFFWRLLQVGGVFTSFDYQDRLFTTYLFYWLMGICMGSRAEHHKKIINNSFGAITAAYVSVCTIHILLSISAYREKIIYLEGEIGQIIFCIASILFYYCIACRLEKHSGMFNALNKLSIATLYIYFSHMLVIEVLDYNIHYSSHIQRFLIMFAALYIGVIVICLAYANVKKRFNWNQYKTKNSEIAISE